MPLVFDETRIDDPAAGVQLSSLDNLIWQLGERHKVPRNVAKSNAFPIVSDDADWNTKGKGRLRRLPPGVVQRVRTVQPGSPGQATFEGAAHPLEFLRDASNADKHHASFRMVLAPAPPPGQHLLTTLTLQLPKEQAELVEKAIRTIKADVDKWMDIHTGPVLDGTIVLTLRLPPGYDYEFIWADAVDLPLSLGAELTDPSGVGPIIPEMENAIRFAREAVQYIAGTTASAPAPFGEADMALIKAAQPETVQE